MLSEAVGPSFSTLAPRIPQELWDLVIDNCRGDTHALRVLSLVCQAWVARARKHLFRSFRLFSPTPLQYRKKSRNILRLFSSMLRNGPHPSLVSSIQVFILTALDIQLDDIVDVVNALPRLQDLELRKTDFEYSKHPASWKMTRPTHLDSLQCTDCVFNGPEEDLVTFIKLFESITHLVTDHTKRKIMTPHVPPSGWDFPVERMHAPIVENEAHLVQISTISCILPRDPVDAQHNGFQYNDILSCKMITCLSRTVDRSNLTELALKVTFLHPEMTNFSLIRMQGLIDLLAPSVKRLSFKYDVYRGVYPDFQTKLSFSSCNALEVLEYKSLNYGRRLSTLQASLGMLATMASVPVDQPLSITVRFPEILEMPEGEDRERLIRQISEDAVWTAVAEAMRANPIRALTIKFTSRSQRPRSHEGPWPPSLTEVEKQVVVRGLASSGLKRFELVDSNDSNTK